MHKITRILTLMIITAVFLLACMSMGDDPSGDRLQRIVNSTQYNSDEEQFQNPNDTPLATGRPMTTILYDYFFNGEERISSSKLPEDPPKLSEFESKSENIRFVWFGHSTILLEIDSIRILIDPVFSNYASPIPFMIKRFQAPVFNIDEINDIDLILISHDHYDHLDYETISKLKTRKLHYLVPLGVGAHLESWGIDSSKIEELDWWETTIFQGLNFTCTPAQHFSGRGLFNGNSSLWASWSIQGQTQNVFFSGDSGYGEHYKKIGNRLGPFDLTFLENGAYSLDWKFVHQLPEEGIQAHLDLKGKVMVPIHWGMFNLALHTWYEPIVRVSKEAKKQGVTLITPKLGQLISLKQNHVSQDWWSALVEGEGEGE